MIDMVIILIVVLVSQLYAYIKTYYIVQFKYVQFIVCQLTFIVFKKEFFKERDVELIKM